MGHEIELRLLGGTAAVVAGDLRPANRRASLLLSLLASRLNAVVGAPMLTDAIWPEGASRTALHQVVSRVRKLLDPTDSVRLETTTVGYPGSSDIPSHAADTVLTTFSVPGVRLSLSGAPR